MVHTQAERGQYLVSPKSLIPHLAEDMPWVATFFPWLLVLMGLMVMCAFVASISLVRYSLRLTAAAARAESERVGSDYYRNVARYFGRVRLVLRVGGLLGALLLGVLLVNQRLRQAWAEFVMAVVYLGLWVPFYISFVLLARASDRVANRMEQLLRDGQAADRATEG